jgi:hypothetical protein
VCSAKISPGGTTGRYEAGKSAIATEGDGEGEEAWGQLVKLVEVFQQGCQDHARLNKFS